MNESSPAVPASPITRLQLGVVIVFIAAYAALSHYSNSVPDAKGLATGLSIGPLLLIGSVLLWRWSNRWVAVAVLSVVAALLIRYWEVLTKYYEWSDVAQQCGAYALVSVSFGRSLFGGRIPLCTRLSGKLYGALDEREIAYTRRATLVWTIFYALLAAAILLLFFLMPLRLWSLFVNFGTFALIGVVFFTDHGIRRYLLPRRPGGLFAALRQSLTG